MELKRKIALIKHVEKYGNVSQACQEYGVSRDSYYKWLKQYQKDNSLMAEGILAKKGLSEVEQLILQTSYRYPSYGKEKIQSILASKGFDFSASGIYKIQKSFGIENQRKRRVYKDRIENLWYSDDGLSFHIVDQHIFNEQGKESRVYLQKFLHLPSGLLLACLSRENRLSTFRNLLRTVYAQIPITRRSKLISNIYDGYLIDRKTKYNRYLNEEQIDYKLVYQLEEYSSFGKEIHDVWKGTTQYVDHILDGYEYASWNHLLGDFLSKYNSNSINRLPPYYGRTPVEVIREYHKGFDYKSVYRLSCPL